MKSKKEKKETENNADENLAQQVEELSKEKLELFEQLQRVSADYANFQKRTPKQIADSVAYEKKAILRSLLPSLDNLEHALEAAKTAEKLDTVVEGVQLVFDHMLDALKAHGLERIVSQGEEFDPNQHEALMQQAEEDKPNNIILQEYQKGYSVSGQVIRPCKVVVNKLPTEPVQTEEIEEPETEADDTEKE
jgi:molecular chaperone GrpE